MPGAGNRALAPYPDDPGPLPAGIHRIALPTPLPVGRVNLYLVEGSPLTLFDSGINSGTALDALEGALADLGYRIEDIEQLVLTHQHIDHVGLATIIARRSACRVAAYALLDPFFRSVESGADAMPAFVAWGSNQLERHGYPREVVIGANVGMTLVQSYGSRPSIDIPLSPGDTVTAGGRDFEVGHRPGHSPSDLVFIDRSDGVAIIGDHLLASTSPNPTLTPPLDSLRPDHTTERLRSLVLYLESLRQTDADDLQVLLPGHGEWIGPPSELIAERFAFHERRADRLAQMLTDEPQNVFQLAKSLWRDVPLVQPYLTHSEVLGHIDLLCDAGRATEAVIGDGVVGFVAS